MLTRNVSTRGDGKLTSTVDDSTAGLGHTLRAGRPQVGGLSFQDVLGLCMSSLAHGLPGGIQAQGMRRPMQAWVSCSEGRTAACDPHDLGGDQRGEQRGPDLQLSTTTRSWRQDRTSS